VLQGTARLQPRLAAHRGAILGSWIAASAILVLALRLVVRQFALCMIYET
jgi:hypothetical protein